MYGDDSVLEGVFGLACLDVFLAGGGVFLRGHVFELETLRVVGDFDQKRDAPAAARTGVEAFGHLAWDSGLSALGEVDQLPGGDVVAVADVVVGVHVGL